MPYTNSSLFTTCLRTNCEKTSTSFRQAGRGVAATRKNAQEFLKMFIIDPTDNAECNIMHRLRIQNICDLLYYYRRRHNSGTIIFCFVELKGRNIIKASEQIKDTVDKFKTALNEYQIKYKCFINFQGSQPRLTDKITKDLSNYFNGYLKTKSMGKGAPNYNIDKFLRE